MTPPTKVFSTIAFPFSSSFERNGKISGHNFRLQAVFVELSESDEAALENKIQKDIINPMHSHDLSLHVDFLKDLPITDSVLIEALWKQIELADGCGRLVELVLERDNRHSIKKVR